MVLLKALPLVLFTQIALSYVDTGTFYRDETPTVPKTGADCGGLCITNPNYYGNYLFEQERNTRLFAPVTTKTFEEEEEINALNYKKFMGRDFTQGLGWGPDTHISKELVRKEVRWSRLARDVGFQVEENGKSFRSALWREIKKPILYDIRDRITAPYKKKALSLREKTQVWILEQTVDAGAGTLNLDSYGGGEGLSSNLDFDISDTIFKFKPRADPIRGRYGIRFKINKYIKKNRPLFTSLSFNYCNSKTGIGNKKCGYEYEFSTSISYQNPSSRWYCSTYLSYQAASLDEGVYEVNGVPYDHKPWVLGAQIVYAFY